MKKIKLLLIGFIGFIVIFFVLPIMIATTLNNIDLGMFSSQLFNMQLPDNTVLVEKSKICGKLNGNGNSMDFLACMLVKSDLTKEQLNEYIDSIKFQPAKSGSDHRVDVDVVPVNKNKLETKYLEHGEINFNVLQNQSDFNGYYALVIYDGGYSSDFDIRGH